MWPPVLFGGRQRFIRRSPTSRLNCSSGLSQAPTHTVKLIPLNELSHAIECGFPLLQARFQCGKGLLCGLELIEAPLHF